MLVQRTTSQQAKQKSTLPLRRLRHLLVNRLPSSPSSTNQNLAKTFYCVPFLSLDRLVKLGSLIVCQVGGKGAAGQWLLHVRLVAQTVILGAHRLLAFCRVLHWGGPQRSATACLLAQCLPGARLPACLKAISKSACLVCIESFRKNKRNWPTL